MENEKFEIKLLVGGTYYPLTINRKDEAMYREAARRINAGLNRYRERYPRLSDERYYVMVAIHIAMVNQMWEQLGDVKPYKERLEALCESIDKAFDEPQDK